MFSLDQYSAAHTSAVIERVRRAGRSRLPAPIAARFSTRCSPTTSRRWQKGRGVYAAYLTPQGRMISDMRVIETGERVLLDVEGPVAAPLAERFDKLIFSEDVQVKNVTTDLDEVGRARACGGQRHRARHRC